MPRRRIDRNTPIVCSKCMEIIDRDAVLRALTYGTELTHECGRVLIPSTLTRPENPSTRTP